MGPEARHGYAVTCTCGHSSPCPMRDAPPSETIKASPGVFAEACRDILDSLQGVPSEMRVTVDARPWDFA